MKEEELNLEKGYTGKIEGTNDWEVITIFESDIEIVMDKDIKCTIVKG